MSTLYLCGGLQSSGSTLVSWCFLQRSDMNGVLDGDSDILPELDLQVRDDLLWHKTTISSFRLNEVVQYFEDYGWHVRPLLIIRDVRKGWALLAGKPYGINGVTAEDPPLRLRLRRFLSDWELFRDRGWPILRYESLLTDPEGTLRRTCEGLHLPWDEGMVWWRKGIQEIASAAHGNRTFWATRDSNLRETIAKHVERFNPDVVAADDWAWLEEVFGEFNTVSQYPIHIEGPRCGVPRLTRCFPQFDVTRRFKWELRSRPVRWLLSAVGISNAAAVERRSCRKAA